MVRNDGAVKCVVEFDFHDVFRAVFADGTRVAGAGDVCRQKSSGIFFRRQLGAEGSGYQVAEETGIA